MSACLFMQGTLVNVRKVKKVLTLIQVFHWSLHEHWTDATSVFSMFWIIGHNSGWKKGEDNKTHEVEDSPRSFHNTTGWDLTARNVLGYINIVIGSFIGTNSNNISKITSITFLSGTLYSFQNQVHAFSKNRRTVQNWELWFVGKFIPIEGHFLSKCDIQKSLCTRQVGFCKKRHEAEKLWIFCTFYGWILHFQFFTAEWPFPAAYSPTDQAG